GTFDFGPLVAGDGFVVARRGNLQAEVPVHVPKDSDPPGVVLQLEPGGRVECSVRDPTGTPVPAAKVVVLERDVGGDIRVPVAADGSCGAEGVPPGEYSADADVHGFELQEPVRLHVRPGETATAKLVLEPVSMLEGTVVDPEGRPVAGAAVRFPIWDDD